MKKHLVVNMIADEPKLQIFNIITKSFDDVIENYNLIKEMSIETGEEIKGYTLVVFNK